jgi:hypothetical protein
VLVNYALGHPNNPMSSGQLRRKFLSLAGAVIGREKAMGLDNLLERMEEAPDVSELVQYLAGRSPRDAAVV